MHEYSYLYKLRFFFVKSSSGYDRRNGSHGLLLIEYLIRNSRIAIGVRQCNQDIETAVEVRGANGISLRPKAFTPCFIRLLPGSNVVLFVLVGTAAGNLQVPSLID